MTNPNSFSAARYLWLLRENQRLAAINAELLSVAKSALKHLDWELNDRIKLELEEAIEHAEST